MKTSLRFLRIVLFCILAAAFLVACGSDDDTPVSGLQYNGLTEPASLDTTTAASDVVTEAFVTADAGISFLSLVPGIDFSSGATGTVTGTDPSCGAGNEGSISYDVQVNLDLSVTGTFTYNGFCSDGTTVNGTGFVTVDTFSYGISISFGGLTMTSVDSNLTLDGSVSVTFDTLPPTQCTLDLSTLVADNNNGGKVYMLNNFIVTAIDTGSQIDLTVSSGTFYHPDYGSVTLETTTDIQIPYGGGDPTAGVVEFTGNNSGAMYDFTDPNSTLWIDTDGDPTSYELSIPNFVI